MRKAIIFVFIFLVSVSVFFSCESTNNDREKPVVYINVDDVSDTIYIDSIINAESAISAIRNSNIFKAGFSDNEALSSYKIDLRPGSDMLNPTDTIKGNNFDTVAYEGPVTSNRVMSIFGLKEASVSDTIHVYPTIKRYDRETGKSTDFRVRRGQYILSVVCLDKAGNYDSIVVKNVILRYPPR